MGWVTVLESWSAVQQYGRHPDENASPRTGESSKFPWAEGSRMADADNETFLRVARMEAFSDGVFAIAITLLVLELSVPPGSEEHFLSAVLSQWPSYLGYIVSFATIGAIWLSHNSITHYLHSASTTFLRLNLALLLVVSFLPFPTKLLAENLQIT
jgi:uncharacterized membrane protein